MDLSEKLTLMMFGNAAYFYRDDSLLVDFSGEILCYLFIGGGGFF